MRISTAIIYNYTYISGLDGDQSSVGVGDEGSVGGGVDHGSVDSVGSGSQSSVQPGLGLGLSLALADVVISNMTDAMKVGVVGHQSSVSVGNQAGISLSVGLTLANVVDTVVGSIAVEGRVEGHQGSVGVGNQASISLGIGLTLADVVDAMAGVAEEAESVALGGQMVGGGGLVGGVQGHHGTVGVGHQTSAHVGGQTQNDLNIMHAENERIL